MTLNIIFKSWTIWETLDFFLSKTTNFLFKFTVEQIKCIIIMIMHSSVLSHLIGKGACW